MRVEPDPETVKVSQKAVFKPRKGRLSQTHQKRLGGEKFSKMRRGQETTLQQLQVGLRPQKRGGGKTGRYSLFEWNYWGRMYGWSLPGGRVEEKLVERRNYGGGAEFNNMPLGKTGKKKKKN